MPESWQEFAARAHRAFDALVHAVGTSMVVSSGGVIARCAQAALGLDDARTIAMNLSIANSAVSDFRRHARGWDLLSWNGLPHLAAAEHIVLTSHY
jgi:broad specificity phosphatase PhoE